MLKIKFADFEIISRSQSLSEPVGSRPELERVATGLLERLMPLPKAVRLLGVSLSSLQTGDAESSQIRFCFKQARTTATGRLSK
jgi:DNA polymerase IV